MKHLTSVYSKKYLEQLKAEISRYREQGNQGAIDDIFEKFRKRFCDVSLFVKELKERFSRWLNKQLGRRGTLWMDRFKSVLVDGPKALATMAAYIDLNPVRAGLVDDPLDYEWSGYGEAGTGSRRARRGICKVLGLPQDSWESRALSRYRCFLYEEGTEGKKHSKQGSKSNGRKFSKAQLAKVLAAESDEKRKPRLGQRVHSFTDGVAIGRRSFVERISEKHQDLYERQRKRKPKEFQLDGEDTGICVLRE